MDANLNRSREALRVIEDVARLGFEDEALCGRIKAIRHEISRVIASVPGGEARVLAQRDTAGDVGTGVSTSSEMARGGVRDIASAACKRLTEALRVVEECLKVESSEDAARVARARYAAYDIERDLLLRFGTGRGVQWRLCVLVTESLCKRPWLEVAREAVFGGADCLQLREKTMEGGEMVRRARRLKELGVAVIVNDRVDVALAAGTDGVHLGTGDLSIRNARSIAGDRLIIGASTHDLGEARAAVEAGADYCGVGAMFPTSTKARTAAGVDYVREYLSEPACSKVPHLAIGGITPTNVGVLRAAGCVGVAVSGAVCGSDDPAEVCRALLA